MKKIQILGLSIAASFIVGCGGGGSSSTPVDPMTQKDAIIVIQGVPAGTCLDPDLQAEILAEVAGTGASDFLFREESVPVDCSTYGKEPIISDTGGCMVLVLNEGPTTCVIGFNGPTAQSVSNNVDDVSLMINNY